MKSIHIKWALVLLSAATFISCKKFVEIPSAPSQVSPAAVYSSDASANSAALAMYSYYLTTNSIAGFTYYGGAESDDLFYNGSNVNTWEFANASVSTANANLLNNLWSYPYAVIREANQVMAGVAASTAMSDSAKNRLTGEAKFFRAFMHLYLVNYFGKVPLAINTLELDNATLGRSDTAAVYAQIIKDLKDAENLLPAAYPGNYRERVNKYAAAALLARAYLYTKDYANAEAEATKVIGATDVLYGLPSPAAAFSNTSSEVVLQFATLYGYSQFGANYRTTLATAVPTFCIYSSLANSYEAGDTRKANWIDSVTSNSVKYYKINKYKLATATAGNEYDVVLRLAEQYLIRAEARAKQNNLGGAQSDINAIRTRAGLGNTSAVTQTALLAAIADERRKELFGEFSHRWFDLKRTGGLDAVMTALKPTAWQSYKAWQPIPVSQISANTNLIQNDGYK